MDSDSWSRLSTGSRKYHSRSDLYYDEVDDENDARPEFLCPFCADEFDVVGLCCHIDEEHAVDARNGVCPVCAKRVGMDLVGHITKQHGSLLKVQRKTRLRKNGSNLTFANILKKELREGSLRSFLGGSHSLASSNTEPDPLLSSFMSNLSVIDEPVKEKAHSSIEPILVEELPVEESERNVKRSPFSDKDHEERARRSEFVQGLLLSTFMDEDL